MAPRWRNWLRKFRNQINNHPSFGLDEYREFLEWLGIDPDEINVRGEKALREATVYACIKILSESVAKLPLKVYRETEQGIEKRPDHYLYQLLKNRDRKSTRLNSSHVKISYAVFCLKKK